jgi:hypothetical protein
VRVRQFESELSCPMIFVDVCTILQTVVLKKLIIKMCSGSIWLEEESVAGHQNEIRTKNLLT